MQGTAIMVVRTIPCVVCCGGGDVIIRSEDNGAYSVASTVGDGRVTDADAGLGLKGSPAGAPISSIGRSINSRSRTSTAAGIMVVMVRLCHDQDE